MHRKIKNSPYWFVLPALVFLGSVIFIPLLYAFFLSLMQTQGLNRSWVGLKNYADILSQRFFWESSLRTAYFNIVSVFLELLLGMLAALLLHQKFRGRGIVRAILILPWALPTVVNGVLWSWIFNASYGSLNALLKQFGLIKDYVAWLGTAFSAMNSVILADVWKNFPMIALILLAGLQTIPNSYYESSEIDGANALQRFFRITLPVLKPSILVCLVMRTMEAFKVFDIVYTMTKGGPANGTQVISYYTYQTSFQYSKFGYGAALSYLVSFIILVLALIYIRLLTSKD
jgi:multiple sugar transport system permease protein/N,N'-diacetylchitobiose transport system permease protein